MSSEKDQTVQVTGPGQLLKSARMLANLSIQDIAQRIHLKSVTIADLEADKYDNNISLTFIKGYLKLYAKQVGVQESELMKAFESINTQKKEPAKLQSFSRRVATQANDDKLMLMTYFILTVVLALVVVWWLQQGENGNASSLPVLPEPTDRLVTLNSGATQSLVATITPVQANNSDVQQASDDFAQQGLDHEIESETFNATLVGYAEFAETEIPLETLADETQSQLAETVELVFEFSADCWMNLSDATGQDIAYGVKASGRVMSVSGLPPFIVTLGAPQSVQIRYAGEVVDMSVFKPGNTAKFTLPLVN